jgi:cell division protein FtsB
VFGFLLSIRSHEAGNYDVSVYVRRMQRAAEEPEVRRLEEEVTFLTSEVNKLNKEQAMLHNDIQVSKQQTNDLSDKIVRVLARDS